VWQLTILTGVHLAKRSRRSRDYGSVYFFLRQVSDPRDLRGLRPLLSVFWLLTVVALLAGRTHLGIAEWGRGRELVLQAAVGFAAGKTPAPSTFRAVFRRLD
jgi:hypothetical protein